MKVDKIINTLIVAKAVKAIQYLSPKYIIRVTRTRYGGKFGKQFEITLTAGKPNFKEKKFIKDCIKAGEKFPVRKIQLQYGK